MRAGTLSALQFLGINARLHRGIVSRLAAIQFSSPERSVLLELLRSPSQTDRSVRERVAMNSGQMSRVCRSLTDQGLVASVSSPDHKKQRLLMLTDSGNAAAQSIEGLTAAALSTELDQLSPDERAMFDRALHQRPPRPARQLSFTRAGAADLPALLQMTKRCGQELGWTDQFLIEIATSLIENLSLGGELGPSWIAIEDGRAVGVSIISAMRTWSSSTAFDGRAHIGVQYVVPSHRGRKIGKQLLIHLIDAAKQQGEGELIASLPARQKIAIALLKKLRFASQGATSWHRYGVDEKWRHFRLGIEQSYQAMTKPA